MHYKGNKFKLQFRFCKYNMSNNFYQIPGVGMQDFSFDNQNFKELNRHEKSLGLLTEKFVQLLKEAPDGVLDLKLVSSMYLPLNFVLMLHIAIT